MSTATTPVGFDAFSYPVPVRRREAAYRAVKQMVPGVSNGDAQALVGRVAYHIERDEPYAALRAASGHAPLDLHASSAPQVDADRDLTVTLDMTGSYRLLAHLCTDPGGAS